MNHAPVLIPLFRTSVKIAVLLEPLVVVIDERADSRIDPDVLRHELEVAVLHWCDLRTHPHQLHSYCPLRSAQESEKTAGSYAKKVTGKERDPLDNAARNGMTSKFGWLQPSATANACFLNRF